MFKKIIFAIILGAFITVYYAQYDVWTHNKIVHCMQQIAQKSLGGNFVCSIQSINFFAPSLVLCDLEMTAIDSDEWVWRCKKFEITCSWLQLLFKGLLDQHIVIDGFECKSVFKNSHCAIESHFMAMMQQSFMPFTTELKSIVFKHAALHFHDEYKVCNFSIFFNSSSLRIGKRIKTMMSIFDGQIGCGKNTYVDKVGMDLSIVTQFIDGTLDVGSQVAGSCMLSHMANQGGCYITGIWNSDRGRFAIRNEYNTLTIDPIIITEREIRVAGRFPLSYIMKCSGNFFENQIVDGTGLFSIKIGREALQKIDGQVVIEDVKINQHHACDVGKIIFECYGNDWKMSAAISRFNQECKGTGYWNQLTHNGEFFIKNVTDLSTSLCNYWRIKYHDFFAHIVAQQSSINGSCHVDVHNILSSGKHSGNSSFSIIDGIFSAHGCIDEDEYDFKGMLYPEFALHHFSYRDKEKKDLLLLQAVANKKEFTGLIAFPFIRSLLNNTVHYDVQGEGTLHILAQNVYPKIIADITLVDGTIRLPQTYNFIDGFNVRCRYDIEKKLAVFEDVNLSLHTGKINCLRSTSYFDSKGALAFVHAPVMIDRCLFNINKDLFALVSGHVLFSKLLLSPTMVTGNIIVDKGQLKENLFSDVIQKQILLHMHSVFTVPEVPLYCDLSLETRSPIRVDTGFFQTNAHMNVRMQKGKHEPSITGSIVLHSGTLNFPYKPLYVSKGIITFMPDQLFNPTIELVARNKIKKYDVSLQVEGSLLTHHIALDATPSLSEEQIVGLLFVGSEENSLNSMMPALIVQNLKSFIFSNNQISFFDKYFKPLLGKFNINLVPSFSDQTGRGGLRGALEITNDDGWRAVIQKNFSLTEDTKFELEFLVSDDITLRAVRDERRDLGGEVEMRWKF